MVEMLIVIGIIVVLAGILLPTILGAERAAMRARIASNLNSVAIALEAYKSDFGNYPRIIYGGSFCQDGASLLNYALVQPCRVRGSFGRVYGPYLQADKFKVNSANQLTDKQGRLILYFAANPRMPKINAAGGYIGSNSSGSPTSLYNFYDNQAAVGSISEMEALFGDYNLNGCIDNGETAFTTAPYVLWNAGPDNIVGPYLTNLDPASVKNAVNSCDDVTNFSFGR